MPRTRVQVLAASRGVICIHLSLDFLLISVIFVYQCRLSNYERTHNLRYTRNDNLHILMVIFRQSSYPSFQRYFFCNIGTAVVSTLGRQATRIGSSATHTVYAAETSGYRNGTRPDTQVKGPRNPMP